MQLRPEQLSNHLARGLAGLYVVHGDEPLLALEAADQIRAAARAAGHSEREVFTVEAGFDWASLLFSGNSMSLFASQRLLEVRIPTGKPGTEGAKALEALTANLPADTVILVTLPKLDKSAQAAKWFKALESAGVAIAVYPVERGKLPAWIGERLSRQGQRADEATLRFVAERVEGNLLAAYQEVQKLALLYPAGSLTLEQVRDSVSDVARFDAFKLADAALAGDAARSARIVDGLRGEGVDPVLVLWALAREARLLARLHEDLRTGSRLGEALRQARVWESRQALYERAVRRVSPRAASEALARATTLDRMIKGIGSGDAWDALKQLALLIAQGRPTVNATAA